MNISGYINPHGLFCGSMVPNWLLSRKEVSNGAKLLYARLAQYANMGPEVYPKIETLSKEVGLCERQIRTYLDELEKHGLIEKQIRREQRLPNLYFFPFHLWMESGITGRILPEGVAESCLSKRMSLNKKEYKEKNPSSENLALEGIIPQSRFEEFWLLYPRKDCKCNANKAWEKITKKKFKYDVQQYILDSVKNQLTSPNHLGKKDFLPHAATWLNQERWLDEVQATFEDFVK